MNPPQLTNNPIPEHIEFVDLHVEKQPPKVLFKKGVLKYFAKFRKMVFLKASQTYGHMFLHVHVYLPRSAYEKELRNFSN